MIDKVSVIDADYSEMGKYFPKNSEFDTSSNLILLAGPNGSGKTGFLRMLCTSIENEKYFRKNKISRLWEVYGSDFTNLESIEKEVSEFRVVEEGWYCISPSSRIERFLLTDPRFDFDPKRDLTKFDNRNNQYPGFTLGINCINERAVKQLRNLREVMSEESDLNIWRYLKTETSQGQMFTQEMSLFVDNDTSKGDETGYTRYSEFDPTWNGKIKRGHAPNHDWQGKDSFLKVLYEKGEIKETTNKRTPGQGVRDSIDLAFRSIDIFFEKGINPRFNSKRNRDSMAFWAYEKWETENVPEGSQLTVFMDEPTVFLDYQGKFMFRDRLIETIEKYGPRIQFFIPTNDAVLIENLPGCKFINLYQEPAQVSDKLILNQ